MKYRNLLIILLILLSSGVAAQPPETIYQDTVIRSGYVDDAVYGPLNIGFNFTYFGNSYSQFYVSSNGLVLFTADPLNLSGAEVAIPDPAAPNNFIAAFWDDLVVDGTGKILYTSIGAAPNRKTDNPVREYGILWLSCIYGNFCNHPL